MRIILPLNYFELSISKRVSQIISLGEIYLKSFISLEIRSINMEFSPQSFIPKNLLITFWLERRM